MSKISALLSILPPLIIIYLLFYNMKSFTSKKYFYGVNISIDCLDIDDFKLVDKKFKTLITLGFLIITSISLFLILYLDKYEFASFFSIITFILYEYVIYIKIHNKVKKLKNNIIFSYEDNFNKLNSKSIVDIEFINQRDKVLKKFKIIYLIPVILVFIGSIYTLFKYPSMKDTIPSHWNIYGKADIFIEKSYSNIFLLIGYQLLSIALISLLAFNSMKSRIKLDTLDIDKSRFDSIAYLNKIGYSFLLLMISLTLLLSNTLFSTINGTNLNILLMVLSIFIMILSTVYLCIIFIKSPNLKQSSSYSPDDEDKYWIWGSIYNNQNDPSFMVQKRFGIGWTINIATPLGKTFLIFIVITLTFLFFITLLKLI